MSCCKGYFLVFLIFDTQTIDNGNNKSFLRNYVSIVMIQMLLVNVMQQTFYCSILCCSSHTYHNRSTQFYYYAVISADSGSIFYKGYDKKKVIDEINSNTNNVVDCSAP